MGGLRELAGIVVLCAVLSCRSDDSVTAPMGQGSSGSGSPVDAGAFPGMGLPTIMDAGHQPPAAGNGSAANGGAGAGTIAGSAGRTGSSGATAGDVALMPDAHICSVPDQIMILDEDADGGLDPSCQNVPRKVIANNCIGGICHDSNGPPAAGLDLMQPCVAERLINVRSHCMDLLIIDTKNPSQSLLFDKLNSPTAKCGETMPFTGHLPPDELACMNAWINAVIRATQ